MIEKVESKSIQLLNVNNQVQNVKCLSWSPENEKLISGFNSNESIYSFSINCFLFE